MVARRALVARPAVLALVVAVVAPVAVEALRSESESESVHALRAVEALRAVLAALLVAAVLAEELEPRLVLALETRRVQNLPSLGALAQTLVLALGWAAFLPVAKLLSLERGTVALLGLLERDLSESRTEPGKKAAAQHAQALSWVRWIGDIHTHIRISLMKYFLHTDIHYMCIYCLQFNIQLAV